MRHLLPGAVTLELIAKRFNCTQDPSAPTCCGGTTFAAVTDQIRRTTAERYLRDTDMTLHHLAQLGYSRAEQS